MWLSVNSAVTPGLTFYGGRVFWTCFCVHCWSRCIPQQVAEVVWWVKGVDVPSWNYHNYVIRTTYIHNIMNSFLKDRCSTNLYMIIMVMLGLLFFPLLLTHWLAMAVCACPRALFPGTTHPVLCCLQQDEKLGLGMRPQWVGTWEWDHSG